MTQSGIQRKNFTQDITTKTCRHHHTRKALQAKLTAAYYQRRVVDKSEKTTRATMSAQPYVLTMEAYRLQLELKKNNPNHTRIECNGQIVYIPSHIVPPKAHRVPNSDNTP
jgi:hypothetical protein